jgi:hypothetical protein
VASATTIFNPSVRIAPQRSLPLKPLGRPLLACHTAHCKDFTLTVPHSSLRTLDLHYDGKAWRKKISLPGPLCSINQTDKCQIKPMPSRILPMSYICFMSWNVPTIQAKKDIFFLKKDILK